MPLWHLLVGDVGLRVTGIWGESEVWRHQSIRWWPDTPWYNKEGEGSEGCWGLEWMLEEADLLPDPKQTFWKMMKGMITNVGGKTPMPCLKVFKGTVLQVLNPKAGGETYWAHNVMLLRHRGEEWNPIKLKTWAYMTISGCLKARVGGK